MMSNGIPLIFRLHATEIRRMGKRVSLTWIVPGGIDSGRTIVLRGISAAAVYRTTEELEGFWLSPIWQNQ
jgi:hypothetical protein